MATRRLPDDLRAMLQRAVGPTLRAGFDPATMAMAEMSKVASTPAPCYARKDEYPTLTSIGNKLEAAGVLITEEDTRGIQIALECVRDLRWLMGQLKAADPQHRSGGGDV